MLLEVGAGYPFRIDSHKPQFIVADMANKNRGWYWRMTYPVGLCACLSLTVPASAAEGDMQISKASGHAVTQGCSTLYTTERIG